MSDNLLKFPSGKAPISNDLPTPESVREVVEEARNSNIEEMTQILAQEVVALLFLSGFDSRNDPTLEKQLCMIIESIRSLIAKKLGGNHVFQGLADQMFEETEPGVMKFRVPTFEFQKPEEIYADSSE